MRLPEIEKHRGRPVVVLASGDPFHYGVGDMLMGCDSRRGDALPAAALVLQPRGRRGSAGRCRMCRWSACTAARFEGIVRYLQPGARILALCLGWRDAGQARAAAGRARHGPARRSTVLEIWPDRASACGQQRHRAFDLADVAALNIIALEIVADADARRSAAGARPRRCAVRARRPAHQARDPRRHACRRWRRDRASLLWDVGLGAGSIAIEWLLRHPSLKAIGFEEQARACRAGRTQCRDPGHARSAASCEGQGARRLRGPAAPDAVFIGGGLSDAGVLDAAWSALKPGGRLVANAVSIEFGSPADRRPSSVTAASLVQAASLQGAQDRRRCSPGDRPRRSPSGGRVKP